MYGSGSDYLDARREAIRLLDELMACVDGCPAVLHDGKLAITEAIKAYVSETWFLIREKLFQLGAHDELLRIIEVEPSLQAKLIQVRGYWKMLQGNNLLPDIDQQDPVGRLGEVKTTLPPIPDGEITGVSLLKYLGELREWILQSAEELWEDAAEIDLPKLGQRFYIGSFDHLRFILARLQAMPSIRASWLELSGLGTYWSGIKVGASRAKLIFHAAGIFRAVISDPEEYDLGPAIGE